MFGDRSEIFSGNLVNGLLLKFNYSSCGIFARDWKTYVKSVRPLKCQFNFTYLLLKSTVVTCYESI